MYQVIKNAEEFEVKVAKIRNADDLEMVADELRMPVVKLQYLLMIKEMIDEQHRSDGVRKTIKKNKNNLKLIPIEEGVMEKLRGLKLNST